MKAFDFVCTCHPEDIREVFAESSKGVTLEQRVCPVCGLTMERYYGRTSPQVALKGANWPKRDIKETAMRKRRSEVLGKKQGKIWDSRMPKLNLDPDLQKSFKDSLAKKGAKLSVKKV